MNGSHASAKVCDKQILPVEDGLLALSQARRCAAVAESFKWKYVLLALKFLAGKCATGAGVKRDD
jgi:hypothetical protein